MSNFHNMIPELIIRSDLNRQLLNEVNNAFYEDKSDVWNDPQPIDLKPVKRNHIGRVHGAYDRCSIQRPGFDYFDGTQLINSLFSMVVVPVERLKNKTKDNVKVIDTKLKNYNISEENVNYYQKLKERIDEIYQDPNNNNHNTYTYMHKGEICWAKQYCPVGDFFVHIRNALCHSGNGRLNFFPQGDERTVTHLVFQDHNPKREESFEVHLSVTGQLIPLVKIFDRRILEMISYLSNEEEAQNV